MHEDVAKAVSSGKDAPVSSAAVKNIHELIANKTQSVAANKTQSVAAPAVASVVREPTDEELNDVHESVASEANVSEDLVKEIHEKIEAHVEAIGPGKKITPVELTPEEVKAVHDEHWEEGARKHNVSDETIEKMRQIIDWKEPTTLTGLRTPDKRPRGSSPRRSPGLLRRGFTATKRPPGAPRTSSRTGTARRRSRSFTNSGRGWRSAIASTPTARTWTCRARADSTTWRTRSWRRTSSRAARISKSSSEACTSYSDPAAEPAATTAKARAATTAQARAAAARALARSRRVNPSPSAWRRN